MAPHFLFPFERSHRGFMKMAMAFFLIGSPAHVVRSNEFIQPVKLGVWT